MFAKPSQVLSATITIRTIRAGGRMRKFLVSIIYYYNLPGGS